MKTAIKILAALIGLLVLLLCIYLFSARFRGNKQPLNFQTDINFEGVLLKPDSPGPYPAVLMLHCSGDSHQAYDKLYFRFHANAFIEKGFAVMLYTKRGSGDNDFDYDLFTYKMLMNDAREALKYLRSQPDIDQENVGIMAVSESGWFSPELAFHDGNIKFIINRVSSPFTVAKTVLYEVENDALNEGFSPEEVKNDILPLTDEIWQYYIDVYKDPTLAAGPRRDALNAKIKVANNDERLGEWFIYDQLSAYDSTLYNTRGQNYAYDPLPYLKQNDMPILYIMGGKDINMPTSDVISFLEEFREQHGKDIDIKVYPDASHYLYKYGLSDGPYEGWLYEEGYLEHLTSWAKSQLSD